MDLSLWRNGAPIFVADPPPFHPLSWLGLPEPLLVVAGLATIAFSTDRFLREPRLGRWLELTLVATLAALGLDPNMLPFLIVMVGWRALRAGLDDSRLAPLAGSLVVAALLSAFWWLPAMEVARWTPQPATAVAYDHIPASVAGHVANDRWQLMTSNIEWWPGWRVYWNGRRLPPVRVHGKYVGAFVPPGGGEARFRYRPGSFDTGLRLTGLGVLLLLTSPLWRRARLPRRVPVPQLAIAALLIYAVVLFTHAEGIAAGADSSGYLNQSRLWRSGTLSIRLDVARELGLPPELFVPLGFVPGTQAGTMVPSYPIGLPLHQALFALVAGEDAQALVSPLAALGCLLLLYLLARRLGIARDWTLVAVAVLALCPVFLYLALQPMSDVLATFWALASMLFALRSRERLGFALAAGAAVGIGVLVRPTHMLLLPAVVLFLGLRPRALIAFALGGLPFAALQLTVAQLWYGSPFRSGYGAIETELALGHFPARFAHYSYWLAALLTPLVFPLALTGVLRRWTETRVRVALVCWFTAFFLFYCFYGPYETWWYTRFLLPAIPALLLLGAGLAAAKTAHLARALPLVALALIAPVQLWLARDFHILDVKEGETGYVVATTETRRHVPPGAVVLGMQHSGAYLHYTGTPLLRWDYLTPETFAQLRATGRPVYALVADFELPGLHEHVPGEWEVVEKLGNGTLYRLR
jgi:hypothetical protein